MRALRLLIAIAGVLVLAGAPAAATSSRQVVALNLKGVVDPFEASYISGAIVDAADSHAAAVLLTIDTPGGLDSSMRKIIQSILNSPVPVICYVSPEGARAASAGAFILLSCDVAVMAPETNVGAASPVGVSGAIEQRKVLNDSIAYIRSLAQEKDRNPDWAEKAVRDAASATADEALQLGVIDAVEPSVSDALTFSDGRTIEKNGTSITIDTKGASIVNRNLGLGWNLLHSLLNPDLAFIFFYLGIGLIIVEVIHPGISIPGILGVLSLAAAFVSFGMLPVQLLGVILLLASAGLFLLELKHPGISVPGIGALITLVAGGLLLFDPAVPGVGVSLWIIIPVAALMSLYFSIVAPAALRARKLPAQTGVQKLIGAEGVVVNDVDPAGTVRVGGELWSAESMVGAIPRDRIVRVVGIEGLRLKVEPASEVVAGHAASKAGGGP
ncbi:MAG: nodulation protein NfeD [Actinomycetota bacterium]